MTDTKALIDRLSVSRVSADVSTDIYEINTLNEVSVKYQRIIGEVGVSLDTSVDTRLIYQHILGRVSTDVSTHIFTITAEIHARSLVNFYGQYAGRHMNLKFKQHVSEREQEI